jgi:hypothetical protein
VISFKALVGKERVGVSVRVIYFLATVEIIYLVLAYPKNVKDSLSQAEKSKLKKLTKLLKCEV